MTRDPGMSMATTTRHGEDDLDLDDGPVVTAERPWPAAIPLGARKGPPPPPPARRARGTAPPDEPLTSGLIDVRAMAAAYAAEREAAPDGPPIFAEGTSPVARIETELAPEPEPEPTRVRARRRWPGVAPRRAAIVVAIGGGLAAAALLAGSLLEREARTEDPAAPVRTLEGPPLVIEPSIEESAPANVIEEATPPSAIDEATPPSVIDEAAPDVRVIPLPTTVTEVAPPARVRRRVAERMPSARAVAGPLPLRPSNSEISSAVVAARKRLNACGDLHGVSGAVPVELRVAASGAITSVAVRQGTTPFRACVARALESQRLAPSQVGTTARFPVLLR